MSNKLDISSMQGPWSSRIAHIRAVLADIGIDTDEAISPASAYGTIQALTGKFPILPCSALDGGMVDIKRWAINNALSGKVALLVSPSSGGFSNLVASDISAEKLVRMIARHKLEKEPSGVTEGWEGVISAVLKVARQKAESVDVQPWDTVMEVGKTPAALAAELGLEYELLSGGDQARSRAEFPVPVAAKHPQALVIRGDGHAHLIVYGDPSQLSKFSRQLLTPAG